MEGIILKYLSNEASDEEKLELLNWLKDNEDNKKTFLDTCNIWLAAGTIQISDEELNDALKKLNANIELYEKRSKPSANIPWRRIAAVAAIFVLLFSAAGFFIGKHSASDNEILVVNNVTVGQDAKKLITLPDGSIAWLNSNSTLTYPERFVDKERNVKLEGEAFFDVSRDEGTPFTVESGDIKIKVLGTEFDVKNYKSQKKIETSLLSGEVEVFFTETNKSVKLEPSQRITFDKNTKTYDIKTFDIAHQTIWTKDELAFYDEKLADIFEKVGYWYGTEVLCEGTLNLEQKLSFTIRNESKEELFKIISLITPIKYQISEDNIIVGSK